MNYYSSGFDIYQQHNFEANCVVDNLIENTFKVEPKCEDVKPPRPRNSFIIFRNHMYTGLKSHGLKINQRELSKIIGVEWKKLSDELKSPFVEVSKYEKEHHKLMYPDYKFKPNKKKKRSSAQNSVKELSYNKNN